MRVSLVLSILLLLGLSSAVKVSKLSGNDIAAEAAAEAEKADHSEEILGSDVEDAEKEIQSAVGISNDNRKEKDAKEKEMEAEKANGGDEESKLEKGAAEAAAEIVGDDDTKVEKEKEVAKQEEAEQKLKDEETKEEDDAVKDESKEKSEAAKKEIKREQEEAAKHEEAAQENVEQREQAKVAKTSEEAAAEADAKAEQAEVDPTDSSSAEQLEQEAEKEAKGATVPKQEQGVEHVDEKPKAVTEEKRGSDEKDVSFSDHDDILKALTKLTDEFEQHSKKQDEALAKMSAAMENSKGGPSREEAAAKQLEMQSRSAEAEVLSYKQEAAANGQTKVGGQCTDDAECEKDHYCSGVDTEAREVTHGECKKKYAGFCKANPDCAAGFICLETSEVEHGLCTSPEKLSEQSKVETEKQQKGIDLSANERQFPPPNLDVRAVDLSESVVFRGQRLVRPDNLKSLRVVEPISREALDKMPPSPVVRSEESCGSDQHHHVHSDLDLLETSETSKNGNSGPENWMQCGNDINAVEKCDNPVIRDTYVHDPKKRIQIQMYWHFVSPSDEKLATLPDHEKAKYDEAARDKKVAEQLATLNKDYESSGIVFHGTVATWKDDELVDVRVENRGCSGQPSHCRTFEDYVNKLKSGAGAAPFFETKFNAVVFKTIRPQLMGFALFPWDSRPIGAGYLGLNENFLGANQKTSSHEIGHALGLLHVFRGVKEVDACSTCYETTPSDITGDLCSDTEPMGMQFTCDAPRGKDGCTGESYKETAPTKNIMSYGPDNCIENFTAQQGSRMRCWVQNAPTLKKYAVEQCQFMGIWKKC